MKKFPTVAPDGFEPLFLLLLKLPQPDLGLGGITLFWGFWLLVSDLFNAYVVDDFGNLYFQTIGGVLRHLWLM